MSEINNKSGEMNSIEEICLNLMQHGWLHKATVDKHLARMGETASGLQRRLKSVGLDLVIVTMPPTLLHDEEQDEWYVILPKRGDVLSDEEVAVLTLFVGTVLIKGRPLSRNEMQAIFGSRFTRVIKNLTSKRLILVHSSELGDQYTFSPAVKAMFRENFEKIPSILNELMAISANQAA